MKGAAYPAVDTETIARATIALPPLAVQRKIAAILSAYDDLIENNTRRIQILEEMAQTIYREWFVKFRFPGHENVTMVDSELGPIPEGWESKTFSDIAELSRDGINPSTFEDELFTHYSFPAFDNGQMPILERGTAIRSNKYIVVHDSVLLSKLNPRFPRVWLPVVDREHRAIASTEFLVLKPKPPTTSTYLFSLCRSPEFLNAFAKRALGTSTSHQRVKPDDLFGMPILLPQKRLITAFSDSTTPILNFTYNLRLRTANLRRTRDMLLPKLISGELDVEDLDIETEGLAQ